MPNWCENSFEVRGNKEDIEKFKAKAEENGRVFELGNFYPAPPILDVFCSPADIYSGKEFVKEFKKAEKKRQDDERWFSGYPMTKELNDALREVFGIDNWWYWRVENWGTKWDVNDPILMEYDEGVLNYTFMTAWSSPVTWLEKVAEDWPNLFFELRFQERGMGFQGVAYGKGEIEMMDEGMENCPKCEGEGIFEDGSHCEECNGSGLANDIFEREFEFEG